MTSPIKFAVATTQSDFARCVYLRALVFGAGQNVHINEDIDDLEADCRHILGMDGDIPCATARWRIKENTIAKIERVAVHTSAQGKGVGAKLMQAVIADIAQYAPQCKTLMLGAQDYVIPFYERLGFTVIGDGYMDANIPHHNMTRAA